MPNYADSYPCLEEALKAMMQEKMLSPNLIVMLNPADEDLNKKWEDAGSTVGIFSSFGNNPTISIVDDNDSWDDERHLMNDLDAYVAAKASKIMELYGVDGKEGWEMTSDDFHVDSKVEDADMAIEPQYADAIEELLDKYNIECKVAGLKTKLTLDRQKMVIEGSFVGKDSNIFNRIKINSQNKKAHAEFRKFLISLEPYLWKLQ
ncbi:MAG: hypothetical protein K2I08_11470 [Muribaculaceae bacterium]|nr:hypothetical protein [Muribaculaceae bacterium]